MSPDLRDPRDVGGQWVQGPCSGMANSFTVLCGRAGGDVGTEDQGL